MSVPILGNRSLRLSHLQATVASSPTFQKLVGANSQSAAAASVYVDLALDDGSMALPRAIIRHQGPQKIEREGLESFTAQGQVAVFVQYQQFTDSQLAGFYPGNGTTFTAADRRQHMNNLFGQMSADFMSVAAAAGYLEWFVLEEFSCGEEDPIMENGIQLVELIWVLQNGGLP